MILYLCSSQNMNLFDFLDKDHGMPLKKMAGTFKLKQFVIHDVRNLSQFGFFIIDLKALKDSENEIIEAITAFGTMYSARVILFAEGLDGSSMIISRLIEQGIYNIITSTEFEDIQEEMLQCVSTKGKDLRLAIRGKYFAIEEIKKKGKQQYSFLCRDIKIGVVGAEHKAGTTTTAMNLVNFLGGEGAEASYIEANGNEHLSCLPDLYSDMAVHENYLEYLDVKYYFKGNFPDEGNFAVIDFGSIDQCNIQVLVRCEVIILCGLGKPYEIGLVKRALKKLEESAAHVVISHVSQSIQQDVAAIFGQKDRVYFSGYSPDLFDGKVNGKMFAEMLKEFLQLQNEEGGIC